MYLLTIRVTTDGDFGYERIELEKTEATKFYFADGNKALGLLIDHFKSVISTFRGEERILKWYKETYQDLIDGMSEFNGYLFINHDFGNPEVFYSIEEVKKVDNGNYFYFKNR